MSDTDLALVSTDELLDELVRRHDAMIFAAYQDRTDELSMYSRRWHGGNIPCLGLARFVSLRIEDACNEMDILEEDGEESQP